MLNEDKKNEHTRLASVPPNPSVHGGACQCVAKAARPWQRSNQPRKVCIVPCIHSSHTNDTHRQLEAATTLMQHVHDVPVAVASHFAQRVVDWATTSLRSDHPAPSGKRKRGATASWTDQQRTACWATLHAALASAHAVTASPALWAAIEHALTSLHATQPSSIPHITAVVAALCTGNLAAAAQPTPEQLVTVVNAAVDVLGDLGEPVRPLLQALLPAASALLQGARWFCQRLSTCCVHRHFNSYIFAAL